MNKCIAEMPSYTYAVKSERLLKARGFRCEIQRDGADSENGCGYSLIINGDCRKAAELLKSFSVPFTDPIEM